MCWCGARGQGCVSWQSVRRVDEEQEQRVDMEFSSGTRSSKDKVEPTSSCLTARPRYPEDTPQTPGGVWEAS